MSIVKEEMIISKVYDFQLSLVQGISTVVIVLNALRASLKKKISVIVSAYELEIFF
jgi:hypothetical protein